MHDEIAVQVGDGRADLQKQPDPAVYGEAVRKNVDRPALDILHREIRLAVVEMSRVEQVSDIGMGEPCKNFPFLKETLPLEMLRSRLQELDRRTLGDFTVHSVRKINHAHAAAPDHAGQAVWPAAAADTLQLRESVAGRDTDPVGKGHVLTRIEPEQFSYFLADFAPDAMLGEITGAFGRGEICELMKKLGHAAIHAVASFDGHLQIQSCPARQECFGFRGAAGAGALVSVVESTEVGVAAGEMAIRAAPGSAIYIYARVGRPSSFVPFSQRILRKTSGFDILWTAASVSRAMHFPWRRGEGFVLPPPRPSEHEQSQPNMSLS